MCHALAILARARGVGKLASRSGRARGTFRKAIGEGANPTLETVPPLLEAKNVTPSMRLQSQTLGRFSAMGRPFGRVMPFGQPPEAPAS